MFSSESFLNWVIQYTKSYLNISIGSNLPDASSSLAYLPKTSLLHLSVASLPNLGIVHGNEYLIQKVKEIA